MIEQESRNFPIAEDMRFQSASWIGERVGWAILAAIAILALAGVFSKGLLSHQTLKEAGTPMTVEYERFQRMSVSTRFAVRVGDLIGDEVRLRMSNTFHESFEIDSTQPRPTRATASPDGLDLYFERPQFGDLEVIFWARPRRFGLVDLSLATDRGGALKFPVLIYP